MYGDRCEARIAERFDVVVVGARCAGSPLAALLAHRGLRVAVVEKATFPRDTLSTHFFQAQALASLERLGVTKKLEAIGSPCVGMVNLRIEDLQFQAPIPQQPGDVGGLRSVRRLVLDPIIADAAAEAGAEMLMGTTVTGVVKDGERVTGVRVTRDGAESTLQARLVVGADGRNSTVASGAGARKYNAVYNQRFAYWSFFEGAALGSDPAFLLHRWGKRFVIAAPSDSGLYQVVVMPELHELPRYREDLEGSYLEHARSCQPVAEALVGRHSGWEKSSGCCAGRASSATPPAPAGCCSATPATSRIPPPARASGTRSGRAKRWWSRSSAAWKAPIGRSTRSWSSGAAGATTDAIGHYWLATDIGGAGKPPTALPEVGKRLLARGELAPLIDLFSHRGKPSQVLTPPRLAAAMGRVFARPGCDRRALLSEIGGLVALNARRQREYRWPVYEQDGATSDAGATEVPDSTAPPR